MERYDEAIACHDKAIEISPSKSDYWISKAIVLHGVGRYDKAIHCYKKSIHLDDGVYYAGFAWDNMGSANYDNGKYDEAIKCYDKALEFNPNNAYAWYNRARLKAKKWYDIESILGDLLRAIEIDKDEYIKIAKEDTDFENIKNDERFKALVGM